VGALLLTLGLASRVAADIPQETAKKPRTFAIIVGISEYADKQIKPRPHAEADAKALYDLVTDAKYLGIPAEDARLLLGKEDDKRGGKKATRAAFLDALKWVAKEACPTDMVLLAFIGQGGPVGETGDRRCYFLADSTFKNRNKDAVAAEEIYDILKKQKSQKFCSFIDIDFKGFKDEGSAHAIAEPTLGKAPYREFLGDDGSDDHLPLPGHVVFLATNGLSTSLDLDKEGHGLFTKLLVDGLKGAADKEGYEPDGLVTVDELERYINKELPDLARRFGKTKKEKEQYHIVLVGPSAHFVLTTNPSAIKANTDRLAQFDEVVKTNKILARYAQEDGARALLERMPHLKKRQELRKAYQGFIDKKLNMARFKAERKEILASMELNRAEAVLFASKVMEAIDVIKEEYVKRVDTDKMVVWGVRELYDALEEKLPADIEKDLKNASSMSERQLRELLARARLHLKKREDLDNQKDLNITLLRMLHKLDPHTTYIDPETKKRFDDDIAGNFTGIGVQISKDTNTDQLLVVTPIKGAPAYRVQTPLSKGTPSYRPGLWAGDVITTIIREVDSEGNPLSKPEHIPTKGLTLSKAVKLILGKADTKVTLTVQREGVEKPFNVDINRGRVEVESVLGAKRRSDDSWDYVIDRKNKIGYIRLNTFARTSFRDMEAVMKNLVEKHDIKGFVLDLRYNPGGLLDIAIKVTDLYIDDGVIVSIHPRGGPEKATKFYGRHQDSLLDFPMVCLVNGNSASGSEIVSAALQDHRRAIIIGERSYGKGSVQNIRDFDIIDPSSREVKKAEIKLTTAAFRRPNGENLNKASTSGRDDEKWGVVPDKIIKLTTREDRDLREHLRKQEVIERPDRRGQDKTAKEFKDRQLDAALEYLRGQIKLSRRAASRNQG
jgi:C-terminal peptidase prc